MSVAVDLGLNPHVLEAIVAQIAGEAVFGRTLYVDPSTGSDVAGRDGLSPSAAFATFARAHLYAEGGKGDRIRLMPGSYTENMVVTKNYLTIEGIVRGYGKPNLVPAAGIAIAVHAQGVKLRSLRAVSANTMAIKLQGNGFELDDIWVAAAGDGIQLLPDLDNDSYKASEGRIRRCVIRACARGIRFKNPGPGVQGGLGPTDNIIEECCFYANTNQDILDEDTAGSNDVCFLNSQVKNCEFLDNKHAAPYITLTNGGANTGLISGCRFGDKTGLTAVEIALAAGVRFAGNFQPAGVVNGAGF